MEDAMRTYFPVPASEDDRRAAGRVARNLFLTYFCIALGLVAILVGRVTLRPATPNIVAIEAAAKDAGQSAQSAAVPPTRSRESLRN
jgi:hypothetical protein